MSLNAERYRQRRKLPGERRGNMLTLRVTREEYDLIQQAADAAGKTITGWCSGVLIDAAIELLREKGER